MVISGGVVGKEGGIPRESIGTSSFASGWGWKEWKTADKKAIYDRISFSLQRVAKAG